MTPTNSTVGGSLLLTTLLTNCQVVPVTQSILQGDRHSGSGLHRNVPDDSAAASHPTGKAATGVGSNGADGVDRGRGGGRVVGGDGGDDDGGGFYHEGPRKGKAGRTRGGGKSSTYRHLDEPSAVNSTRTVEESDPGAVMYIIVVLVFYSTGVMVMIVRYLRTEKKELEEEVTLENFFKSMPDKRVEKEHRVNLMAIRAFHTLTSVSYDDDDLEGLDLGSDTETESRDRKSLDATSSQPLLVTDL